MIRMTRLECVPNLSEGRRPEVVARLAAAAAVPGVQTLDLSSDVDHNRSVLTLAGEPEALHRGLLGLYAAAVAEIDLRRHEGVHPRVGAVDVAPFVALGDTPPALAVAAAERLGAAVADRFALPVYLYEQAARRPERRSLAEIRKGNLAGLERRLATDPAWQPDFGPARLHPTAGAAVIGARFFLLALNLPLDTADVAVARALARRLRESSGGLPAVRALGVYLASRGRAQLSMNLIDFRRTSLATLLERAHREAAALSVELGELEVIGLVPEAAVEPALRRQLAGHILEERLER
jgi:glutamate formiminotransferase